MRPFWLRPKWVVGHVLVVALVGLFVNFGFWQLRRHDERQGRNATIEARASEAVAPLADVVDPGAPLSSGEDVQYRRATVTGSYDVDGEVLVRSRSLAGRPGYHIATPLVLDDDDDRTVLVNRGFLPLAGGDLEAFQRSAAPPEGDVEVSGLVFASQERDGIGPRDPVEGQLDQVARLDIDRVQAQYDGDLYPVYLQLTGSVPAQRGDYPTVLPPPVQDDGPHLSYAAQWFLFAAVGAIGWPVLLRRTSKEAEDLVDTGPPDPGSREHRARTGPERARHPGARGEAGPLEDAIVGGAAPSAGLDGGRVRRVGPPAR